MTEAKQSEKRTLVEEGTELKGSLTSSCPVLVRGRIEGDVKAPSLTVSLDAPADDLADLPAAVEVACYRIVTEALTNVTRHAHATQCSVRLRLNHGLDVKICDDGVGLPEGWRAGVGIASMRERVTELGGDLVIEPNLPHGTRINAHLPGREQE